ncbi:hypothetical protein J2S40_000466 [Nocardioides luteus]|uniref:DUF1707 domain-containing protein n=1 Tax=Nocardioides luteus TaxID=1844 RepID=A0ABQ5SW04_9ACTN|nr:DUF1707 domain-containing protein [Nocardioides luteus]MDR7309408.1 hypothetical protein [Nocardioides luteus]GGR51085.1 hypothetical protein GCM10010197_16310 [Nocardioides luteus]GLJ67815.1 hypothetical protein GCM10017579_18510 [Nocardioides luteus]
MGTTPEPYRGHTPDPSLRISDADRHKVADILREAAGEGRLDIDELDDRLEATFKAKTYADLVPITVDLPAAGTPAPPATRPAATGGNTPVAYAANPVESRLYVAIMSGVDRRGIWTVPVTGNVIALMGGAELDMRQAEFSAQETTIYANAIMGGITITVGPEVQVVMQGVPIMGGFDGPRGIEPTGGPVLRVKGLALMGGVTVVRKPLKGGKGAKRLPIPPHELH